MWYIEQVPRLDRDDAMARFAAARVARLATVRPDGSPRLVPVTFAVVDGLVASAVDTVKPKRDTRLARLTDVEGDPRVGLLADEYDEDWSRLWWVRLDGTAALRSEWPAAVEALRAKYEMYQDAPFAPPYLEVRPSRWTGWSAR